jgi:hypothetical protein
MPKYPKYPNIEVQLSGGSGNVFAVMGKATKAMRRAKVPTEQIDEFLKECKSGDYDHALQTCMAWVDVT